MGIANTALEVGDKRKFSFSKDSFTIREVLENPNIHMFWSYDSGVCPHCKKRLVREVEHIFYKVEILGKEGVADKDLTRDTIQLHGFTLDNRNLILTIETYDEVFDKSDKFKHLKISSDGDNNGDIPIGPI